MTCAPDLPFVDTIFWHLKQIAAITVITIPPMIFVGGFYLWLESRK